MSRKPGFTLIELLLVIVIIGVLTAISVPSFVRSMQGNRLRSAARTVAAAGRYARSMAVLHQRPVAVTFALDGHEIVVDLAFTRAPANGEEDALEADALADAAALQPELVETDAAARSGTADDPAIRIERTLDGVRIARVDVEARGRDRERPQGSEQHVRILYGSNGRCQPYQVVLQDDQGLELVVVVDVLGGTEIQER